MFPFAFLNQLAAQAADGSKVPVDQPDWHYWVAIGTLSGVVATLFGILMKTVKSQRDDEKAHRDELKQLHKGYTEAAEEKAKRTAEEFARKDKTILDTSVEFAKLMEQVVAELRALNKE